MPPVAGCTGRLRAQQGAPAGRLVRALLAQALLVLALAPAWAGAEEADAKGEARDGKEGKPKRKVTFPIPPDVRPAGCAAQLVDEDGKGFEDLKASIIIPYRNENWEHIRGSVESILYFTPKRLIREILFVSDGNKKDTLFANELRSLSSLISVLALPHPGVGLIEAKMRGVGALSPHATVIIFLEPHIRVNKQWLEPLLARVRKHPRVLAMPLLDHIPQDNFHAYLPAMGGHWRFEWNFNLIFTTPGGEKKLTSRPYLSPATSGGIFAIRKDWWDKLGFYDTGMEGWGGDHVEATFKVWMCGGHIEVVPCSRIGHLFRDPAYRPYPVDTSRVVRNYARQAAVWLDEYLPQFQKVKSETVGMNLGNLSEQQSLRERLKCRSFTWYLENVDRELQWEKDRICIPGCSRTVHSNCCEKPGASGRSTIDRTIPDREYVPLPDPDSGSHPWNEEL